MNLLLALSRFIPGSLVFLSLVLCQPLPASAQLVDPTRMPASAASPPLEAFLGGLDPGLCADWNPEYGYRGYRCCYKAQRATRRNRVYCAPERRRATYCEEMTPEQKVYSDAGDAGQLGDVLEMINRENTLRAKQAYCSVNSGFLAFGRRLIPSETNRITIRNRQRCIDFGTDPMIGMLEWAGRQLAKKYSDADQQDVRMMVGDISAPRGGCLVGRSGRKGHASHTSGQDADVGFVVERPDRRQSGSFSTKFDAAPTWWLMKQIFNNPYVCVKVMFLDRKLIGKLRHVVGNDPEWARLGKFIRHVKYHKNHFHVRVGDGPGSPGCREPEIPDDELEEEGDEGVEAASGAVSDDIAKTSSSSQKRP